jgi:hypothetical protein
MNPMTAADVASAGTLARAVGRENQSAMKPIASGPRSMPPQPSVDAVATPSGPASVPVRPTARGKRLAGPSPEITKERCAQGGSERAEQHADGGGRAAGYQGAGPAPAFEQPCAGESASGHGERVVLARSRSFPFLCVLSAFCAGAQLTGRRGVTWWSASRRGGPPGLPSPGWDREAAIGGTGKGTAPAAAFAKTHIPASAGRTPTARGGAARAPEHAGVGGSTVLHLSCSGTAACSSTANASSGAYVNTPSLESGS